MVDFCCQYLEREVSEDNYLYLQELALLYSLERLDTFIDHFILSRFETLSFTPDFLRDIPLNKLSSYLSSGKVNLSGGMQVVFDDVTLKLLSPIVRCSTTASRPSFRPPCSGSARVRSGPSTPGSCFRTSASL